MLTPAIRTVTQHSTPSGVAAQNPSAPSVVEGRLALADGALSYAKAGTGPAVLLIHGPGGTRHTWRHLIPGLALTHTVIAPDLPGHGLSDPPSGDYSLGAHACAMRDLLLTLGHRRANFVGHSLGGGVALQTAYQFPERTDRVVLISGGGLGASDWHGQTASVSRQLGQLSEVPVLVAWGADDKTIPPPHHQALADRVRHAVTVEIADAGHYPHETAPTQLLSALQTFLAATRPFRYVEERWVRLLAPGHASSPDHVGRH